MLSEKIKWIFIGILMLLGLTLDYFYGAYSIVLRIIGWCVFLLLLSAFLYTTNKGAAFVSFVREAQVELRKVFWPTRQETLQVTFFVAVMVLILALVLWGMDSVLVFLLGWLTGQRG